VTAKKLDRCRFTDGDHDFIERLRSMTTITRTARKDAPAKTAVPVSATGAWTSMRA
jgi:hypothetical protein